MRKLYVLIPIVFILISCNAIDITTEQTTNLTTSVLTTTSSSSGTYLQNQSYASDIVIKQTIMSKEFRLPQQFFYASFSSVKYFPITKSLTVTVVIGDADYHGAEYYLVGRYKGSPSEERKHFVFGESSGQLTYTFDNVDLSNTYEVLVTKVDSDDLNSSSTLFSVCTLELNDPHASERYEVTKESSTNNAPEFLEADEMPFVDVSIVYADEHQAINQLIIALYSNYDKTLISDMTIDIDSSYYDNGFITLDHILFSELSPAQEYIVQIYGSGNDGVDSFTQLTLDSLLVVAPAFENCDIEDSFYNLFAVITKSEVIGDEVVFYYKAINNESYTYSDTHEPVTIMVSAMAGSINETYEHEYNVTFELDPLIGSFSIPYEYASKGANIRIYDFRNTLEFCNYVVNPGYVSFNAFVSIYHDLRLELLDNNIENVVSLNVKLFNSSSQLISEHSNLEASEQFFTWELPSSVTSFEGWYIVIDYESDSIIGILSHQKIIQLH